MLHDEVRNYCVVYIVLMILRNGSWGIFQQALGRILIAINLQYFTTTLVMTVTNATKETR